MGQYYKPVNLDNKEWLYSHDYSNGLKLMEHSWLLNNFVNAVETLLIKGGKWFKNRIVWAGDYADEEKNRKSNLYGLAKDSFKISPREKEDIKAIKAHNKKFPFIVNHDKKEFVDKSKVKKDSDDWRIHPLPLLTCEGNGRGGGDFRDKDPKGLIGSWARDTISIEKEKPKGFTEIKFDLVESR